MFDQLDQALRNLLDDRRALSGVMPELYAAEISFITPEKGKTPSNSETVNLFLYETKENRELREAHVVTERLGDAGIRRRAPLRVDCSYMVTAWSGQPDKVAAEHKLLGQAFNWLSRFPRIPLGYFDANVRSNQVFVPPTMVAQMDGAKSAGEFWHALGIAPRPYFNLMVTITMELDQTVEDHLVTTIDSLYWNLDDHPANADESLIVGGTVRGNDGRPVPEAWVRLDPHGQTVITDTLGRFVIENVARGTGYTLRARATGFVAQAERINLEIPSPTGEYDLKFPRNPP